MPRTATEIREIQLGIRERVVLSEYLEGRTPDPRSLRAIQVARRYLQGEATREELGAVHRAAEALHNDRYGQALWALGSTPTEAIGTPGYRPYNDAVTYAAWVALQAIEDVDEMRSITGAIPRAIDEAGKAAESAARARGLNAVDAGRVQRETEAALNAELGVTGV